VPLAVPPDLEAALAAVPAARARFDALAPEAKDAWIAWVGRGRTARGRAKRNAYVVRRLGGAPVATTTTIQEEAPPPLPPRQEWWPWLLALALALLIAALLVWLLVYRDNGSTHNTVVIQKGTVPAVVGQPQAAAVQMVKQASLNPVVTKKLSATQAPGIVIAQNPAAGKVLKGGAPVTLVVSRGPPPVAVPNVQGLAAADAVAKLQQANLAPRLVEVRSKQTAGTVVAQNPAAGTKAKPGSRVTLDVSKGVGKVTVPVVTGETVAQAVAELKTAGFKAQTSNVASDQPKGNVVTQLPRGGEAATKGATVKLAVSQGPKTTTTTATTTAATTTTQQTTTQRATTTTSAATTTQASGTAVPQLTGKGLATGLQQLETAGLRASVKYQSSQAPVGRVLGQNPAAGTKVAPKATVQVNVSEGPNPGNPTAVPDVSGEDEATARSDLETAGFKVIVIQTSRGGQSGTVVEQQPAAGTTLASGDFVAIYVAR
jgi:beta-lactam-binding protein with PASTA domain